MLKRGIIVGFVLGLWSTLNATSWNDNKHYFGISVQGAYNTVYLYSSELKRTPGAAGGAHLWYEYQHNTFILNIGAGFVWQQAGWALPQTIQLPDQGMTDSQGSDMILRTFAKRQDEVRRGIIDIPLLMGREWGLGYLLGGVKLGIGMVDLSRLKASVTTIGIYDQYIVPLHDEANHAFYTDQPISRAYRLPSQWDIRASIEGGVSIE